MDMRLPAQWGCLGSFPWQAQAMGRSWLGARPRWRGWGFVQKGRHQAKGTAEAKAHQWGA